MRGADATQDLAFVTNLSLDGYIADVLLARYESRPSKPELGLARASGRPAIERAEGDAPLGGARCVPRLLMTDRSFRLSTLGNQPLMMDPEYVAGHRKRFVLHQARVFDAPAERVFGLLTEPTALAKWWGPHGFSTPEVEIDLRVGGSYRFTMQPPEGEAFHLSGEFLEIQAPSALSFTFRWDEPAPDDRETVVELSLNPLGEGTKVTMTQTEFATHERLELHRGGWADSFEKLDSLLKAEEA